ncbi:MAG: glutamate--tRNA ligase [Acidobacteriota bacterium]|nr:MAG: glutamate--tRNA ligase [Acidobacteriota bacterium]
MRLRFAPSPTGYLHIGSARTFAFNWLYARQNGGTMILRIDDTDIERNTEESLNSIFDGLKWLDLDWDEEYHQSERLDLYRRMVDLIFSKGLAYRDFTPAYSGDDDSTRGTFLFNAGMRELSAEESDRRAAAESFVIRFRVPRGEDQVVTFNDEVYGPQSKSTADIEDFALLRSNGMPTYHVASCADDIDIGITHIIRGQDHLSNTFKHVLLFEAMDAPVPVIAHVPLLTAPDGAKLSKRKHGPAVSVTTFRDAGFLAHAFINFICLLGWSPKDNREVMSREELIESFSLKGINRSSAVVNFTEEDPIDPKALWLNAQHIHAMPVEQLCEILSPVVKKAGYEVDREKMLTVTSLVRERIRLIPEVLTVADFILNDELAPYDPAELIPQKADQAMTLKILERAKTVLTEVAGFDHSSLEEALRGEATNLGVKTGQMFQPVRVAVCGRKNAPPLFETLEVVGRETCLKRIDAALGKLMTRD